MADDRFGFVDEAIGSLLFNTFEGELRFAAFEFTLEELDRSEGIDEVNATVDDEGVVALGILGDRSASGDTHHGWLDL